MDVVTSLILSNNLQFDEGEIRLLGTNLCLIPPKIYLFLFDELRSRDQEQIFYETCKESASQWFTKLASASGKASREDLIDFLPKILNLLAYGKVSLLEKDFERKKLRVKLEYPLYPELYGKSAESIDLSFAGFLAGAASSIFKQNMVCKETSCAAQKSSFCEFEVYPGEK